MVIPWEEIIMRIDTVLESIVPESRRNPGNWYPIKLLKLMKEYAEIHDNDQLYAQVKITSRYVVDQYDYNDKYFHDIIALLEYIEEMMLPAWE